MTIITRFVSSYFFRKLSYCAAHATKSFSTIVVKSARKDMNNLLKEKRFVCLVCRGNTTMELLVAGDAQKESLPKK